jgi:hypothetical protein
MDDLVFLLGFNPSHAHGDRRHARACCWARFRRISMILNAFESAFTLSFRSANSAFIVRPQA